jgi:hypothetical protein
LAARIERGRGGLLVVGEHIRVGIDGGGQEVRLPAAVLGVVERQLGEDIQIVGAQPSRLQFVLKLVQRRFRIVVKRVGEVPPV